MNQPPSVALRSFDPASDLDTLIGWFRSADDLLYWGGPGYAFPIRRTQFESRLKLAEQPACVLSSPDGTLVAFGQIYLRQRRLHFARLIVSPPHRGSGLGGQLIDGLQREGIRRWGRRPESLWVLSSNRRAIALYRRLGFVRTVVEQPFGAALDVDLMVRPQPS